MLSTGLFKPRIGDFIQLGSEGLLSISSSFTFGFWGFSTGHYGLECYQYEHHDTTTSVGYVFYGRPPQVD